MDVVDTPEVCPDSPHMSLYSDNKWYALHVRSRHEKSVHAQLQAKQHDSFLPAYSVSHRWADRWKVVSMPLFPGYIFCRFDPGERSSVLATSGIIDLVRSGGEAAEIKPSEIDAIQRAVNSKLPTEPFVGFATGNRVLMTEGPLKGLMGTLMEIRNGLRLVISVELLCRSVLVEIKSDWVRPCKNGKHDLVHSLS